MYNKVYCIFWYLFSIKVWATKYTRKNRDTHKTAEGLPANLRLLPLLTPISLKSIDYHILLLNYFWVIYICTTLTLKRKKNWGGGLFLPFG